MDPTEAHANLLLGHRTLFVNATMLCPYITLKDIRTKVLIMFLTMMSYEH